MRLLRIVGKIVVIALALVGAVTLVPYLVPNAAKAPFSDEAHVRFIPSPDGSMKAAIVTYAGGGGLSPHCFTVVSILPDAGSETDAEENKFTVFTGVCDTFAVRDGFALSSPIIEWLSNTALKITNSIQSTGLRPATVTMKARDASGRITVQYEAHE